MNTKFLSTILLGTILLGTSCKKGVNIFTIEDDKNLGLQTKAQIESDPTQYPILDKSSNPAAYAYLENIKTVILNSGTVEHKNDFTWELYIIKDDNTLNAFCTPGGYIYVYTGLIKYMDDASSLAGVLGHEMAHADRRHTTQAMTEQYGIETLLSLALGKNSGTTLAQVATQLTVLKFSRNHETEADTYSTKYLCPTKYHADGAANFFSKMLASQQGGSTPVFLSTHPADADRVNNIKSQAATSNCAPNNTISTTENVNDYNTFKSSL